MTISLEKKARFTDGQPLSSVRTKTVKSPERLCLYRAEWYDKTLAFFDEFDTLVLWHGYYVVLDFSELKELTAAASLMLFAKVTRCQCCVPKTFAYPDAVVNYILPVDKAVRDVFRKSGLWAAIKPGGESKLERLWGEINNPYKTGNDPSSQMGAIIEQLLKQVGKLPRKIVSALQESYLNIAHHAYEGFKDGPVPLHGFMVGRWWQFVKWNPQAHTLSLVLYDMGVGIPDSIRPVSHAVTQQVSDCASIALAMRSGVTRFKIQGRGRGFNDIKSPIDANPSAEYLLVFSGNGLVVYRSGKKVEEKLHGFSIGGTLIEWTFSGVGK